MPRERQERILETSDRDGWETVVGVFEQRGETKETEPYKRPTTFDAFKSYINGLSGDDAESALAQWQSALDRQARGAAYESLAAESTVITVGKQKIDILSMPLASIVRAYNGIGAQVEVRAMAGGGTEDAREAAEKSVGFGPWRVAARKLVEKGAARLDEASGTLVAV